MLDADIGVLRLGDDTFDVLQRLADGGAELLDEPALREQVALLRSAFVLDTEGRFHPSLVSAIAAIRQADNALTLTERDQVTRVWLTPVRAALLLPLDDTLRRRLTDLPVWALPDAVSRLVDLGPRPRPAEAEPVSLSELLAGGIRRRWTLERTDLQADDGTLGGSIEVVDTEAGLWVVEQGDDGLASPSNPTAVWRAMISLVRPSGGVGR